MLIIDKKDVDKSFTRGAFSLTVSAVIVKLLGFIYKVPLSYILTDEGMGYFNSAYVVFSFFFLLCTGGVPRAISIIITDVAPRERAGILRALIKPFFIIGLLLFLILTLSAHALSYIIGSKLCAPSLMMIAPSLIFVSVSGVLRGYLNGVMSFGAIAISQIAEGVVKLALGMLLALLGHNAGMGYAEISALCILGVTLGSLASSVILYIGAKAQMKGNSDECALKIKHLGAKIFRISAPITLSSAILGASSLIDLCLIVRRLVSAGYTEREATALFGNYSTLVIPLINLALALLTPISAAALPMLGERIKEGISKYSELVTRLFLLFSVLLVPISLAFLLFPLEILSLLFDDASAGIGALPLMICAPSVLFLGLLTLSNTCLEAMKDTKAPLIATGVGVILKTVLTYILVPYREVGISGAAIGGAISYAIAFFASFLMLKAKGVKLAVAFKLLLIFIFSLASVLPSRVLYTRASGGEFSIGLFIIFVLTSIIIYLILLLLYVYLSTKMDKNRLFSTKYRVEN